MMKKNVYHLTVIILICHFFLLERTIGLVVLTPPTRRTIITTYPIRTHVSSSSSSLKTWTSLTYLRSRTKLQYQTNEDHKLEETVENKQQKDHHGNKPRMTWDIRSFLFQRRNGTQQHDKNDMNDNKDISQQQQQQQQQYNDTLVQGDPAYQNLSITVVNQTQLNSKSHAIQPYNHHSPNIHQNKTQDESSSTNKISSTRNHKPHTTSSSLSFDPFASIRYPPHSTTKLNNSTKRTNKESSKRSIKQVIQPNTFNLPLNITDPNKPLSFQDLQHILSSNGYIRREEMNTMFYDSTTSTRSTNPMSPSSDDANMDKSSSSSSPSSLSSSQRKIKGVAMPQPTKVSNRHIRYGTMIASGFFFVLVAISIQPNLWLIGSTLGAVYGNDIATKAEMIANGIALEDGSGNGVVLTRRPGGLYGDIVLKVGKKIATVYLQVWDVLQTFWFLYRTGQLSYEYYQTYAKLDTRYGIQSKIDAWNSRFIEGKENFDRWEKENEVGRKLLAGMRTLWMVEENSYKKQMKGMKKSKYRIVRYFEGVISWSKRFFRALWGSITGGGNGELREILKGMKLGLDELSLEIVSQRIGAAVTALIAVNFVGAMFAVAPMFLGVTAVTLAVIFPNWLKDTIETVKDAIEEARARGRGERINKPTVQAVKKPKLPLVEKNSFAYYIGTDGKKKWYRTGQSRFKKLPKENESDVAFQWPWSFTK